MQTATIRASSLSGLFDCPAQWQAKNIDKIAMPRSPRSLIGNAVHEGAAAYDASRVHATGLTINEAAGVAVDYILDKSSEVDWIDLSPKDVEAKTLQIHQRYCAEISPKFDFVIVEAACNSVNIEIDGINICLTGTPDRVYQDFAGDYGGLDLKTGFAAVSKDGEVETIKHIAQAGVYEIMLEQEYNIELREAFVIAGMSTAGQEPQIGLGMIPSAKAQLLGNPENDTKGLLHYAANILKSGMFYGNPRSMTCTKQYCPIFNSCKFRGKLS